MSPDGLWVAFVRRTLVSGSVLTASLSGSGERVPASYKTPEWIYPPRAACSPDGKTLAFVRATGAQLVLTTIAAEGGPASPVAGKRWNTIEDLTWLPGSRLLVVAGSPQMESGSNATSQLYEVSVDGGEASQITHGLSSFIGVRACADGKTLLALQDQVLTILQVATPGRESEARPLSAENQNRDGDLGLAWTPNGNIIYRSVPNGRGDLWEMGADGSTPQPLTNSGASSASYFPAVSPRGGFIAFTQVDRSGQESIWRMEMDGSNAKQLTQGKPALSPAISPDARWVIYTQLQDGKDVLMKVPSEGGPSTRLTDNAAAWASVSPDGKWIACLYYPGRESASQSGNRSFRGWPTRQGLPAARS